MTRRLSLLFFSATALVAAPARAGGWQELHQLSDDVRILVADDGTATVQHHLRFRVVAGKWKTFEVVGIDPSAEIASEATVTMEKGNVDVSAHAEVNPKKPDTIRIVFDERPRGLTRGTYVVDASYKLDLVKAKMITRDGAMWRVAWTAPPSPQGHDGARVVFELPQAPTEPRLAKSDGPATTIATLRRLPDRDELELVRAHVPRGEAALWAVRVDPKAFPKVTGPELRPAAPPAPLLAPERERFGAALVAFGFAVLAALFATILRGKIAVARAAAATRGATARLLVPIPLVSIAYGGAASGALAALVFGVPLVGGLLVALAMALASHRAPTVPARPRGPGVWTPVLDAAVLLAPKRTPLPGDALDIGALSGKAVAAGIALGIAALAYFLRTRVAGAAIALPLAGAALVPIFFTGTRAHLPERPEDVAARVLRPARDALARTIDLAHVDVTTIARTIAKDAIDEVRLAFVPVVRTPGLRSIELAVARGAAAALPEVLVRFDEESQAAARIATIAPGAPIVPGRTPEERVMRVAPDDATPEGAARVVAALLSDLEDRRGAIAVRWSGVERRCPDLSDAATVP